MTLVGRETRELLTDLYRIAAAQADMAEKDLTLIINWQALRGRLQTALISEGLEVPVTGGEE